MRFRQMRSVTVRRSSLNRAARQLIVWHPEAVNGLDPETGRVKWSQKFTAKAGMTIATPRQDGPLLLVSCFYNGSMMLKLSPDLSGAVVVWRGKSSQEMPNRTDGLHSVMATPLIKDGYIYGVCSYGELRCLKEESGERVWKTMQATSGGPEDGGPTPSWSPRATASSCSTKKAT